jgi:uncharacterized protein
MLFVFRLTDRPDAQELRNSHYAAHSAWLDAHANQILVAGILKPEEDGPHVAAIWIVKAANRDAALALADSDPFWAHGLRATREVYFYKARSAIKEFTGS